MNKIAIEKAEKLPTKRLLAYYKKYGHSWSAKYFCDCCGTPYWDFTGFQYVPKETYDEDRKYWDSIKEILNNREHVEK